METFKKYVYDYLDVIKQHPLEIIFAAVAVNLFMRFGIGQLFFVALIGLVLNSLYTRFSK